MAYYNITNKNDVEMKLFTLPSYTSKTREI